MKKFKPFVLYFGKLNYGMLWGFWISWGLVSTAAKLGVEGFYNSYEGVMQPYRHSFCIALDIPACRRLTRLIYWRVR